MCIFIREEIEVRKIDIIDLDEINMQILDLKIGYV